LALGGQLGCGSGGTGEEVADREASAACPTQSSTSEPLVIVNETQQDFTFSASAPNCTYWSGNGFPARHNGREIPARLPGDPPVKLGLSPANLTKAWAPNKITLTSLDGKVAANITARFDLGTRTLGLEIFDAELGDFVKATPVTVGETPQGRIQAVGGPASSGLQFDLLLRSVK
jgi:hypothetical protein